MSVFRLYAPEECGEDGYPLVWHRNDGSLDDLLLEMIAEGDGGSLGMRAGIKHLVRAEAGNRCIRCFHPFIVGQSGHMEGNAAAAKGLAATLTMSVEELDATFEERAAEIAVPASDSYARTNWSACDALCRHGGPMRAWTRGHADEEGWSDFDPTPEACGPAVGTLRDVGSKAEAAWRILTVHHLTGVKADLRWWNLAALCQRCHLLVQGKVVMDKPWPWEHTDWFKPHAAAWYGLRYLGLELDREETEDGLDALLALGREQESVERMPV